MAYGYRRFGGYSGGYRRSNYNRPYRRYYRSNYGSKSRSRGFSRGYSRRSSGRMRTSRRGSKKQSKYYISTLRTETAFVKVKMPLFGYIKVLNVAAKKEFFAKAENLEAFPVPAFRVVLYNPEDYAASFTNILPYVNAVVNAPAPPQ